MISSSKKAVALYQEIVPTMLSLIIIGFIMFSFFSQTSSAEETYTFSAPDISNTFPITFLHSFLYQEITQEQKEKLGMINNSENLYLIDIIEQYSFSEIEDIYNEIKEEYINDAENRGILKKYQQSPSSLKIVSNSNLLVLTTVSSLLELDCIEKENYFFALSDKDNLDSKIIIILFQGSYSCSTQYASTIAPNLN